MEQLVQRIKRIQKNPRLSDALLLALLSKSDLVPDCVNSGVICNKSYNFKYFLVFERGEAITFWYLLLSGEVELYLPAKNGNKTPNLVNFEFNIIKYFSFAIPFVLGHFTRAQFLVN